MAAPSNIEESEVLTDKEREDLLEKRQMEEAEIRGVERKIRRELDHREEMWTTVRRSAPNEGNITVVLVGQEGVGKSALGNLLIGEKAFVTSSMASMGRRECEMAGTEYDGRRFTIVDTPAHVSWEELAQKGHSLEIFNDEFRDHWMVVSTNSLRSYGDASADAFIEDVSTIRDIAEFMEKIKQRVVLVDSGSDQPKQAFDENMISSCEKAQARRMVFDMINRVVHGSCSAVFPRQEHKEPQKDGFISRQKKKIKQAGSQLFSDRDSLFE